MPQPRVPFVFVLSVGDGSRSQKITVVDISEAMRLKHKSPKTSIWVLVLPQTLLQHKQHSLPKSQDLSAALQHCDDVVISDSEQDTRKQLKDIMRAHELKHVDRAALEKCLLSGGTVAF